MPVYTVHGPVDGADEQSATDKLVFVRDGFHFWALVFGPLWLLWHRLWLALLGYIVALGVFEVVLSLAGIGAGSRFFALSAIALLMGLEVASLQRWTLSRRRWRQLGIVVANDREAAERRFFDQGHRGDNAGTVFAGSPPPSRGPQPGSGNGIIGLFPEPGSPR